MVIFGIGASRDVCDPKSCVKADTALEAEVRSLATRDVVDSHISTRYHQWVGQELDTSIAGAIRDEDIDIIRHLVFLVAKDR